jgi:hypothetical protein
MRLATKPDEMRVNRSGFHRFRQADLDPALIRMPHVWTATLNKRRACQFYVDLAVGRRQLQ